MANRPQVEGVAIQVYNLDRSRQSKALLTTAHPDQAKAIILALRSVEHVETMAVRRDFDAFGRMVFMPVHGWEST